MVYTNPNGNILIRHDCRRASSLRNGQTIHLYTAKLKCIRCNDKASKQICCIMNSRFNGTCGITDSSHHLSLIYNIFAKINQLDIVLLIKRKKMLKILKLCFNIKKWFLESSSVYPTHHLHVGTVSNIWFAL